MENYFTHLNYFFKFAQFKNLPTSARITYLSILYKWNDFRRKASFSLSDRELSSLTGLSVGRPITESKRLLKNLGLIDFKSSKHGTTYFFKQSLGTQQSSNNVAPPSIKMSHDGYISNTEVIYKDEEFKDKGVREEGVNLTF